MAGRVALLALFIAGALAWCLLLSSDGGVLSGPAPTVEDWPKEFRYYSVLQQAVRERRVPLFVSRPILAGRKLLALPELNCTPPVLLLAALSLPSYVLLDTLLHYGAGFAGLLLLRRRYRLGWPAFTFLFLLFVLNGHLVAHMTVGHSMWAAHFLLPFFVLGVLELVEGGRPRTAGLVALVLFAILLRGGFHLFVWCVLFLVLLAAFNPRRLKLVAAALGWSAALGAVRLAPAAFLARRWDEPFVSGFPSLIDLWHALVSIRDAAEPHRGGFFGRLGWWEYDTYVGPAGLVLLCLFGVALARSHPALEGGRERGLYGPLAVMAALSLGDGYLMMNLSPLPLLNAERVSSRLLLLPVLMLGVVAALRMQRWWAAASSGPRPALARGAALLGLAAMATGLIAHAWQWRLQVVQALLPPRRGLLNVELVAVPSPLMGTDLAYVVTAAAGALATCVTLVVLVARLARRFRLPAEAPG